MNQSRAPLSLHWGTAGAEAGAALPSPDGARSLSRASRQCTSQQQSSCALDPDVVYPARLQMFSNQTRVKLFQILLLSFSVSPQTFTFYSTGHVSVPCSEETDRGSSFSLPLAAPPLCFRTTVSQLPAVHPPPRPPFMASSKKKSESSYEPDRHL